ncbi:ATP-binding protein [Mesobacillus foraminis]|uniref:histidine kinase n=1 Tax=Mesobacillus foraminis TaxID=279826 RepID=A0A4R2BLH2_9BACI|nr:ATP-binding protein [Mesobacillus foraminis]TCN28031.1 signal transduction histidine kinase [Mesobacillus foraminis]
MEFRPLARINKYFHKSLARQYIFLMGHLVVALVILAAVLLSSLHYLNEYYSSQNKALERKEALATEINKEFTSVFLDIRGYIAFGNKALKDQAVGLEPEIRSHIREFKKYADNRSDREFIEEVEEFSDYYFITTLPKAIEDYESDHVEEVVNTANTQATARLQAFQKELDDYLEINEDLLDESFEHLTKMQTYIQIGFILFVLILLLVFQRVTRLMFKRIGQPLSQLAAAANDVASGRKATIEVDTNRVDELGILSHAFNKMVQSIKEKEQNLISQNEELVAQQDELQAQQYELENTLEILKSNEERVKNRNSLVNTLSNSLDKQGLLESTVLHMCRIIEADSGIIALVEEEAVASFGVSRAGMDQFKEHLSNSGYMERLKAENKPFIIKRESQAFEKGFHTSTMYLSDLYLPIFLTGERLFAVMVFSRFGEPFEKRLIEEYSALGQNIGIALDKVNHYEKSEEERVLNQDILDTIKEGVQLIGTDGRILQVNKQLCEMFNATELTNTPWQQWTSLMQEAIVEGEKFIEFVGIELDGNLEDHHFIYTMKRSRQIYKVYTENLFRGKDKFGTILVHRNITKEFEVDQMKSEFVSTVSHELRTPLASILGFTELMINRDLKAERQKKYLNTIYQEAKRLTALINDFLDVQRMEAGKQTYEKNYLNLLEVIDKVIDLQQINAPNHKIELESDFKVVQVLGDREKLGQAFTNLVSNAVKYSPSGGNVTVTVKAENNKVLVSVKDEGLGIPEDAMANLFTKFYRVDNSDRRKIGGTGLGLAIVQEIIKAHEGEIHVNSQYGKGSTFTVILPGGTKPLNEDRDKFKNIHGRDGYKVLVIEDDQSLAELMTEELNGSGFQAFHSKNDVETKSFLKKFIPDAIVLDILLGDESVNGWEIMNILKRNEKTRHIPIIVSTALDEKAKGFQLGAHDFLVKPYQQSRLSAAIMQTLTKMGKVGQILIPENDEHSKT